MGQMIDFSRPDGRKTKGYFAQAGAGRPGIVVIQEWWGLNDQICGVADRFARAGYNALAPDLYEGRVTQKPDEANHLMTGLDFPGAAHQDIRGAVQYLVAQGGKVGVMGFCMGGALAAALTAAAARSSAAAHASSPAPCWTTLRCINSRNQVRRGSCLTRSPTSAAKLCAFTTFTTAATVVCEGDFNPSFLGDFFFLGGDCTRAAAPLRGSSTVMNAAVLAFTR
jgi:hypothetical protein